jgi:hypothetical protein
MLLSPTGDNATGATLVVARCRCRVTLAIMLPSHVGDGAAEMAWLQHNVDVESCWRQCCRVMLTTVLSRRLGRSAM